MTDKTKDSLQKQIVILGGGFGGAVTIFELLKRLDLREYAITLIDKNDYHFYYPNTYEVATAEEDFSNLPELKSTIAFPFVGLLPKGVKFIQGVVTSIDRAAKTVTVNGQTLVFDYCVVSMGSEAAFYGIPGLADFALTMKSFTDAIKYRNAIEQAVQMRSGEMTEVPIRVVVGGGGFTGIETASETVNLLGIISEKYGYNLDKFEILVVDSYQAILNGQPEEVVDSVVRRMRHLQIPIEFRTGFAIKSVDAKTVVLTNGEVIAYDVLVWTGGVQAVPVPFLQKDGALDKHGRVLVDTILRVAGVDGSHENSNIFAIGDNAIILDVDGRPLVQTAQQAVAQGVYLGRIIPLIIRGKSPAAFVAKTQPFILPVCGKWAVARFANGYTMYGFIPWLMRYYAMFDYLNRLMPTTSAIAKTWTAMRLYSRNDM